MSHQVLARKWRPRSFEQMVGQPHVVQALSNALQAQRLHHAYLFTGTRGVGKTTVARVLAKCLNCEGGITSTPCGQCSACQEIDSGRFLDLIEVDAASRTGVDDTRDLLENVPYAPSHGRFKVYLIDEVHMFSKSSFNALLKTLEEPPPHVKFLLATTDPQKMPPTVLSRCLQFHLKPMPAELIARHLERIMRAEQIRAEPAALLQIAQQADGSMRDALSLLDQAIAYGAGVLEEEAVRQMLGVVSRTHLLRLLQALIHSDAQTLLSTLDELATQGPDYDALLAEFISLLHQLAVLQQLPHAAEHLRVDPATLQPLVAQIPAEDLQLYYQIALLARRDLSFVPNPRLGLEMALLRMLSFRLAPEAGAVSSPAPRPLVASQPSAPPVAMPAAPPAPPARAPAPVPLHAPAPPAASPPLESVPVARPAASGPLDWAELLPHLNLRGMTSALANNCVLLSYENHVLRLGLTEQHGAMRTENAQLRLTQALQQVLGSEITLHIEILEAQAHSLETPAQRLSRLNQERQLAAEQAIHDDALTQSVCQTFDAEIVPGSIRPLNPKPDA